MTNREVQLSSTPWVSRIWRFLARRRIPISLIVVVSLIAVDMIRRDRPHSVINLSDPWSTIGLLFLLTGSFIRSWSAGILQKNAALSTSGPYAITRNPLYLGSFLMMIGFCTLLGAWHNFLAMLVLAVVLYWPKIKSEEAHLQRKFGQHWNNYVQSTPRLLPHRLIVRGAFTEWSFAQWWRNTEHITVLATVLGLLVFQVWFYLLS